jgi:hypothetical protein
MSWWIYSGGFKLLSSPPRAVISELVELFWWNHAGGVILVDS